MRDELSLVVLAAGMGRRFGALKQVAPVGPGDEALVDHTIRDATVAGIDRVLVVVRPEIRSEVTGHLARRATLPLHVVDQPGPGPGRTRPWGVAEAVALALEAVPGPAVVVNADDYYGADAVASAAAWLRSPAASAGRGALVTWPLSATVSPHGAVTRALVKARPDGTLAGLEELHEVEALGDGAASSGAGVVDGDVPVSMNLWALPGDVAGPLRFEVDLFKDLHRSDPDAELPLPTAIDALLRAPAPGGRSLAVDLLPAGTTWVGVTHSDDLPLARERMSDRPPVPVLR